MKNFICNICGIEVSRRKSFQYKDGRACKIHQEANQANTLKHEHDMLELKKRMAKKKRIGESTTTPPVPRCWGCQVAGTTLQDVYAQMIISLKKIELKTAESDEKINFFDQMNLAREDAVRDNPILVPYPLEKEDIKRMCKITGASWFLVDHTHIALLCNECAKKANLKHKPREITPDQLTHWSVVAGMMEPAVKKWRKINLKMKGFMMKLPDLVMSICNIIRGSGGLTYVVGGAVRDSIIGAEFKDIDLEIYNLDIDSIIDTLVKNGFDIDIVGKSFGVIKVKHHDIDISIPRRDSKTGDGHKGFTIEGDPSMTPGEAASRRDFTINSMAYDPINDIIIDPFDGLRDLHAKILRHTSSAFSEDPLRVLRGMQFVARFDLDVDSLTLELCKGLCQFDLSRERILEEWKKLITKGIYISKALKFLVDTGWIDYYPELRDLIGVEQDSEWHPEGDVFIHTGLCMDAFASLRGMEDVEDQIICGFAVLCHDFGKPATTEFIDGQIRSRRHEYAGKEPTRSFMSRLMGSSNQKKPNFIIESVVSLVTNHMAPTTFAATGASKSAIRRLANRVGRIDWLTWVSTCDKMGRGPVESHFDYAEDWLRKQARELEVYDSRPKRIVFGRHLIDMGLIPNKTFGSILQKIYDAQMDGKFKTADQGIDWYQKNK